MSKIELVASDIDGTLLFDWRARSLGDDVLAAVEHVLDRGIVFAAASGRQYFNVRGLFGRLADRVLYICENGTLVMDSGEVFYRAPVDSAAMVQMAEFILASKTLHLLLNGVSACYVHRADQLFYERTETGLGNLTRPFDDARDVADDLVKAGIWYEDPADPLALAEVDELKARFGDTFELVSSGVDWYDIVPRGQSKAVALKKVGESLGIAPANMAAFGDNYNDVPMLDLVGHPFAMESGKPELLRLNPRVRPCRSVPETLETLLRPAAK